MKRAPPWVVEARVNRYTCRFVMSEETGVKNSHAVFLVRAILMASAAVATAQQSASQTAIFTRTEVMVPMRDDVKLQTVILAPRDATRPLPILITRTPYGVPESEEPIIQAGTFADLMADGYIFVFQNLRGRFKSEGTFVMQRPPCEPKPKCIDESTDAYDTVDWLIKNVPNNNGKAGIRGVSTQAGRPRWP